MTSPERQSFEQWISSCPYERNIERWPDDETKHAWPGQYQDISVQLAWEAWQESRGNCGLRYALDIVKGRRILNRPTAYLAALDEIEIFLNAAIERVEHGEPMHSTAVVESR